jgi:hypothetical protein
MSILVTIRRSLRAFTEEYAMTAPVNSAPAVPLSSIDHAPLGAWTSLYFGAANQGVAIAQESAARATNADLLVALHREGQETVAFPFVEKGSEAHFPGWRLMGPEEMLRHLTPSVDEYSTKEEAGGGGGGLTLRVYTPHAALPNPKRSGNLQYATAPGVLLELIVDNSGSDTPATAFIGLRPHDGLPLRPLDWSSKTLVGVGRSSRWLLAAPALKNETFTLQSNQVSGQLAAGNGGIDPAAGTGGILLRVPARTTKILPVVVAWYQPGLVTQGIDARYFYTNYFPRIEAVANFLLHNSQRIRESCTSLDSRLGAACPDSAKLAIFSHAVRAYEASTQVLDAGNAGPGGAPRSHGGGEGAVGPSAYFATITREGYRDSLHRAAANLPWELYRNPWVIRNLFDLATSTYAYHDKLRFPSDPAGSEEPREGGMTFARVFGFGSAYAPGAPGTPAGAALGGGPSAFDSAGSGPGFAGGRQATDSLLNAVYLLTSYALLADDTPWAKTRLPFARELLTSMENRDHWDPEQRTGILKAESLAAGGAGQEGSETIGLLDLPARGSLYVAVKTFCASLMLTTYFQNNNDLHSADYSYAFAQKTARSIVAAFDGERGMLPANLLSPAGDMRLLAALEPLAVPTYVGLTSTLSEYFPELFGVLKAHAEGCLQATPTGCIEAGPGGGLRLASGSNQASDSTLINVLFVLERLFQIDLGGVERQEGGPGKVPGVWQHLLESARAAGKAAADPASLITAALYMKLAGPA